MAQKIWSEYFQLGNASAEEAIPGAIIHMQTRDGNDEALTGAVNMQWDDNAGLFLPTDKDNPLEARVRHLEALVGALNATKETNPDAASATLLALLRGLMATGATESTLGSVKTAAEALAGTVDSGALKTTLSGSLNAAYTTTLNAVVINPGASSAIVAIDMPPGASGLHVLFAYSNVVPMRLRLYEGDFALGANFAHTSQDVEFTGTPINRSHVFFVGSSRAAVRVTNGGDSPVTVSLYLRPILIGR